MKRTAVMCTGKTGTMGGGNGGGRDLSTAVAGLNAAVEKASATTATLLERTRQQERVVTTVCLAPDGQVIKSVRIGPPGERQFALPTNYWETERSKA